MEALIKTAPITNATSTKKIRELYDQTESNLRSLRSIGIEPQSYGCLFVPILKSKLLAEITLILSRKFDENDSVWEINKIMTELKLELLARERAKSQNESSKKVPSQPFTTDALLTNEKRGSCPFCKGQHFPDKCRVVTDVNRRKELM